jgi:hypothetical protein
LFREIPVGKAILTFGIRVQKIGRMPIIPDQSRKMNGSFSGYGSDLPGRSYNFRYSQELPVHSRNLTKSPYRITSDAVLTQGWKLIFSEERRFSSMKR